MAKVIIPTVFNNAAKESKNARFKTKTYNIYAAGKIIVILKNVPNNPVDPIFPSLIPVIDGMTPLIRGITSVTISNPKLKSRTITNKLVKRIFILKNILTNILSIELNLSIKLPLKSVQPKSLSLIFAHVLSFLALSASLSVTESK